MDPATNEHESSPGDRERRPADDDLREANRKLLVAGLHAQREADDSERDRADTNALLAGVAEGVVVLDALGRVLFANPAASRIMCAPEGARQQADLLTLPLKTLADAALPFEQGPVARALRGEGFVDEEIVLVDGVRERRVCFSANSLQDSEGRVLRVILTCRDVTDLRELERLREEYLALISHDLRNPLTIIRESARRMARDTDGDSGLGEMVGLIQVSAERMGTLIDDLMESAYLETGLLRLENEPVALGPLVASVLKRLTASWDARAVSLECPPALEPILADGARIERVVANLLTNALKYSDPGTPIVVTVRPGAGEVVVAVRDEGLGIPHADLSAIFGRYHRARREKVAPGSYGLGLHIARLIVAAHGGRLWAESEVGVGSTFSFALPTTDWPGDF